MSRSRVHGILMLGNLTNDPVFCHSCLMSQAAGHDYWATGDDSRENLDSSWMLLCVSNTWACHGELVNFRNQTPSRIKEKSERAGPASIPPESSTPCVRAYDGGRRTSSATHQTGIARLLIQIQFSGATKKERVSGINPDAPCLWAPWRVGQRRLFAPASHLRSDNTSRL